MSTVITDREATATLSANVRRLLAARGMSMRDLAAATGETPMQISRIARGHHVPNFGTVARIAECFDVSIDALLRPVANSAAS